MWAQHVKASAALAVWPVYAAAADAAAATPWLDTTVRAEAAAPAPCATSVCNSHADDSSH